MRNTRRRWHDLLRNAAARSCASRSARPDWRVAQKYSATARTGTRNGSAGAAQAKRQEMFPGTASSIDVGKTCICVEKEGRAPQPCNCGVCLNNFRYNVEACARPRKPAELTFLATWAGVKVAKSSARRGPYPFLAPAIHIRGDILHATSCRLSPAVLCA